MLQNGWENQQRRSKEHQGLSANQFFFSCQNMPFFLGWLVKGAAVKKAKFDNRGRGGGRGKRGEG